MVADLLNQQEIEEETSAASFSTRNRNRSEFLMRNRSLPVFERLHRYSLLKISTIEQRFPRCPSLEALPIEPSKRKRTDYVWKPYITGPLEIRSLRFLDQNDQNPNRRQSSIQTLTRYDFLSLKSILNLWALVGFDFCKRRSKRMLRFLD